MGIARLVWQPSRARFVTGLYIVIVPLFGLVLHHPATRWTWGGVALAVAGLYLLSVNGRFTIAPGDRLVLAGAFFWAAHILLINHYSRRVDALRLSAVQFAACSLLSLTLALVSEHRFLAGAGSAIGPLLYGGIISVGIAYTLQVVGQRTASPAHAAIILSTEALFGALGGALILDKTMTPRGYAGCALMMTGILLSQLRTSHRKRPHATQTLNTVARTRKRADGPPSADLPFAEVRLTSGEPAWVDETP